MTRVYLPLTFDRLSGLAAGSALGPAPMPAFAVTAAVAAATPEADDEEREHLAYAAAARASLDQVLADPAAPPCRVVVAADVPAGEVDPSRTSSAPAAVTVTSTIAPAQVAAVFVDDEPTRAAVLGVSATRDLDALDDVELCWYAPQELAAVVSAGPGGSARGV